MASEKSDRTWTPIVVALIAGGVSVFSTMWPFYHASQKNLEKANQTNQTADNETDGLRKQLASLQRQLQRCEATAPGTIPGATSAAVTSSLTTETPALESVDHDFKFHLLGCKLLDSGVQCNFTVTNLMGDRELSLSEARIIDDSGTVYPATGISLGADSGGSFRSMLPGAVPMKAGLKFASVRPGTKRLEVLEITGYNWPAAGGRDTIVFKFRGISL